MPDMLRTLGLLFLALIAAAGIALGYWYYQDRQARHFVAEVTPLIFTDWNVEALTHRSVKVLQTPEYEAQVRDLFKTISRYLGPLESATAPQGRLQFGPTDRKLSRGLYGNYTSTAKFRDAEAALAVPADEGARRMADLILSRGIAGHLRRPGQAEAGQGGGAHMDKGTCR